MSKPTQSAQKTSRPFHRNPALVVPAALLLVLALTLWFFAGLSGTATDAAGVFDVRRGSMRVSITEGGTLRAANEVIIVSQLEGEARIIYIMPEGSLAEKGDLLVELDASDLEERLTERQIAYQNALSNHTEARENFAIKKSEMDSEIKLAELALEFAKVDLEKYTKGDWLQTKNTAINAIRVAEMELKRAEDRFEYTKKLEEKGYATRTELEADELDVTRRRLAFESAEEELRLLTEYDHPKQIRTLQSDLEQAEAALARMISRASAELSQAEATLKAREATLELEKSRLDRVTQQLENTKIYAPQPGLVVYATTRQGGDERPVEEGTSVRQRQEIIKLPDLSSMLVEVKVHESQISQVRVGQEAVVTVDSIPDRRFRGRVKRVAVLPDSQSRWLNPDLRVYSTEVLIEDDVSAINPGVSARAEILVSQLYDVVQVPIQAVTTFDGQRIAYRSTSGSGFEPVPVEIGLFNDAFVQINSGLLEGDQVMLSAPRTRSERGDNRNRDGEDEGEGDEKEGEEEEEAAPATVLSPADALNSATTSPSPEREARGNGADGGKHHDSPEKERVE